MEWAKEEREWNHNVFVLGDFNIDRKNDPNYKAFTSKGLQVPAELDTVPRTIFDSESKPKFYDQIAWFTKGNEVLITLEYTGQAGGFDFTKSVLTDLTKTELSWKISDHYPLWAEFSIRGEQV